MMKDQARRNNKPRYRNRRSQGDPQPRDTPPRESQPRNGAEAASS